MQFHLPLAALLTTYPKEILPLFDEAIEEVQRAILSVSMDGYDNRSLKEFCHARISGVSLKAFKNVTLPRSSDVGSLVAISGTVIRTGSLKLMERLKDVRCTQCKQQFTIYADLESDKNTFPKIKKCQASNNCKGKVFVDVENSAAMTNYQEIKVQEQIQSLSMGSIPRSIIVILMDELADTCQAGDDITIVGIPMRKWGYLNEGERCNVQTFILGNHIHVNNEREFNVHITEELKSEFTSFWDEFKSCPLQGRDLILRSVCPQVFGMYFVKLAFLVVLIGGKSQTNNGIRVRGESHLLMVGEPGTGKSQFLKYAAKLGQRSVMTTGTGSTSAGLTVTAVKDKGGEWILEAGALVLSDGGVCCIDEFNCIKTQDRATIHEAMEQQTLSVAKAGLVCKLNSRCTIIAACNPKGSMDESNDIAINLGIASPLLSRFDLVLLLQDNKDSKWDEHVSSFILSGVMNDDQSLWNIEQLKSYIAFIKATISPTLSEDAQLVLISYYKQQRNLDSRNQARTTIRLLESMVRLTEAHARLMFRKEAIVLDAIFTIVLVECSMLCSAISGVPSALHSFFPDDPDSWYEEQEVRILRNLNLEYLIGKSKSTPPSSSSSDDKGGFTSNSSHHLKDEDEDNEDDEDQKYNIIGSENLSKDDVEEIIIDDDDDEQEIEQFEGLNNVKSINRNVVDKQNVNVAAVSNSRPQQQNIWSVFTQREPELIGDNTVAQIAEDRNPIDKETAAGLEARLAERFEERRVNKEKERKEKKQQTQTFLDWDNICDNLSEDEDLFSGPSLDFDLNANSVNSSLDRNNNNITGKKRSLFDNSDDDEEIEESALKVQKCDIEETPSGIVSSPPSSIVPTKNSQVSQTLASLRIKNMKNTTKNTRKKFVD